MFEQTQHSRYRASQRGLSEEDIAYILHFGRRYYCFGAVIFYLRRKDVPATDRRRDFCTRLIGAGVVMTHSQRKIITVWRNRKGGLRWIRTKRFMPSRLLEQMEF